MASACRRLQRRYTVAAMARSGPIPAWLVVTMAVALAANLLAGLTTGTTIELMGGVSRFAVESRVHEMHLLPYWRSFAYAGAIVVILAYLRPLIRFFRSGAPQPTPEIVQRRAVSGPLVIATLGFALWLASVVFFVAATVVRTGGWSTDLMSQQVLSPLVNGFLAATTTYLLVDWVFRRMVMRAVFPGGQLALVRGAVTLGVLGRMLIFLTAVAFVPIFTLLGLVRAAAARLAAGVPVETVVGALTHASEVTFVVYVLLGIALTLVLARVFTRPLGEMAAALRRIDAGDLDASVAATSADEVGVLADGVNAMVAGLRERERILATFGRIVEPTVRDHLLSGELRLGGELRRATVLFCDLRGFTSFAEAAPPQEVVATLNSFFTAMTSWVRQCGGFVDKFVGDAMFVVFGLFDSDGEAAAAAAALRCAVGMRDRLAELNAARAAAGHPPLALKIGVHSGEVVAGTIGSADRHEYTVIGDTVNVAARLEAMCRDLGQDILVSARSVDLAGTGGFAVEVTLRERVAPRGRSEPIEICAIDSPG